eukprot:scaffold218497_cov22-Prasinocladus_malaysianus.AAC.1
MSLAIAATKSLETYLTSTLLEHCLTGWEEHGALQAPIINYIRKLCGGAVAGMLSKASKS